METLEICSKSQRYVYFILSTHIKQGFWDLKTNADDAFATLEKELNIRHPDDWLSITRTQLQSLGAIGLPKRFGRTRSLFVLND